MNDDEQLLARAKQLDPVALREFHQRFYEPVARYIQFRVGDARTVEDLSGEVFVRAFEGLRRGQAWRDSPGAWITGIARNVVAEYYRWRERMAEVELSDELVSTEEGDPIHQTLINERASRLRQAIQRLTVEQQEVLLLRFMEGVNIQGVAKAINKTPGAVKALQHRALRALAELMQDLPPEKTLGEEMR